jgi:hypothetical protein
MRRLILRVSVPDSAQPDNVVHMLTVAAYHQQGITITEPKGISFDVDLVEVTEVPGP